MYFNNNGKDEVTYDAIVVGSGISGGWAAKELCEGGLKTMVLERGRMVKHGDYPTAALDTWEVPNRGKLTEEEWKDYDKQRRTGYTMTKFTEAMWPKDSENPYSEDKPFDWIRSYQVGGRSLLWGRQSYRWSEIDFEANAKDGIAVDWPIRYKDIAPWYDKVEKFVGVSGQKAGLPQLPDGQFLPPMQLNCIEKDVAKRISEQYTDRMIMIGRTAHLTEPIGTRGVCMSRNRCMRGCPYGAYFSSNASTLPAAEATGNLTIRPWSIVTEIIYDEATQKAKGVRIQDAESGEIKEYFAKVIFLCASAFGSTWIMMNSKSKRFPNGFGNDSGELGHNVMDHHFRLGASGRSDKFKDQYFKGRRPNGIYVPRFQNIDSSTKRKDYIRGFGYQGGGSRAAWWRNVAEADFGADYKNAVTSTPGDWNMGLMGFGECLPYHENRIYLNDKLKDKHGLPTLTMDAEWKENEYSMRKEMMSAAAEMLEKAGLKDVNTYDRGCNPGLGIHEMGTARMGRDAKTSVLNGNNQVHAAKNVYVTDGACMTSSACVNPSLTYMALTARAAAHAIDDLKKNG
ncbi:MAG: GMC family oxidoreductase [Saprospiraceae bacterium]|nr:GMC family oxidoreductase [Saprospiraceae bacterium]